MKKVFNQNNKKGFSLVETLVAIFILAMAITAAMTVAQQSLNASFYARDRILATFLAQEAIELVKNRRDENGLKNSDQDYRWLQGIANWDGYGGPCGNDSNEECGIDIITSKTPSSCSDDLDDCELFQKTLPPLIGAFAHCPSGEECAEQVGDEGDYAFSGFFRKIKMEEITPNEASVTVTVTWDEGVRKLEVTEHIFNWHPFSPLEE